MPSLLIDIGANIARLQQDMAKAQGQITSFAKSTERAFSSLGSIMATAGVTMGMQQMVQSFMDAEKASMKMAVAMRNQGDYSKKAFNDLQEFTKQIQRTTAAEDDATLSMMANLKSYGMTNDELKKATKAALDFAAAKEAEGMSATTAGELIGKAYAGNTATLSRYGIVIDNTLEGAEKFNAVMTQLEQRFGGAAQAELETYAGQWKKLKNDFGDVAEVIGIGLLKSLEGAMFGFSMVSVAFYRSLEGITAGIGWFYDKIAQGADMVGLSSVANVAASIAGQMNSSSAGYAAIKEEALRMADANYTAMTSFDSVDRAVSKMRSGTRTRRPADDSSLKKGATEALKNEILYIKQLAEAEEDLNKARYEFAEWENNEYATEAKKQAESEQLYIKQTAEAEAELHKARVEFAEWENGREKVTLERLTAERDMYQDMRGFEQDYYTSTTLLIESQARKYRDLGISEVTVAKWMEGEKLKALDAYVDKAGTLYERLEKRTRKYAEDAGDVHKGLFEAIDAGAKDLERQMSDNFFDALTGNFQRVRLDWDSMWGAMARSASDYMAKIAVTAAIDYTGKAVGSLISTGLDWLVDSFLGYGEGAWEVKQDKITAVHAGEMIIPADRAAEIRAESGPSAGESWAMSAPSMNISPELGYAINQAAMGFMGGYARGMFGKELAGLALTGKAVNPVLGLIATLTQLGKAGFAGYAAYQEMTSFRDIAELATEYGGNLVGGYMGGIGMDMGGYEANYGGGGFGDPSGDMGGPGGDPGDNWRYGGISSGSEQGHRETLHGTEAVVPLPDGRTIPVEMKNGGGDLPPVQLILQADGRQLGEVLFKLSRSGVKIIHQNGITAL